MVLTLENIELKTRLPKLPGSISLFELETPSLKIRKPAINVFTEILELGEVIKVELKDSVIFGSNRGEVEYFHASGSIWARDATVGEKGENEECKWDGLEKKEVQGEIRYVLNETTAERLSKQAHELLKKAELLRDYVSLDGVELE